MSYRADMVKLWKLDYDRHEQEYVDIGLEAIQPERESEKQMLILGLRDAFRAKQYVMH